MEIKEVYIQKYWEQIVTDQLADELKSKGYHVEREKREDNLVFDLYAEKGSERRIYEIKQCRFSKNAMEQLQCYAREHGINLQLIISKYADILPKIDIDFLPSLLCDYMNTNHPHDEIAYSDTIEDITDISFSIIQVNKTEMFLKGFATCDMEIRLDNEGVIDFTMSFPMTFETLLVFNNGKWTIDENKTVVNVDDSKFYE